VVEEEEEEEEVSILVFHLFLVVCLITESFISTSTLVAISANN
jgi:hypothetical protein